MSGLTSLLADLPDAQLRAMGRGVEKESLRSQPDGGLAFTPHPAALGSALTHPHITTDFCESQLEFVTGVHGDAQACLEELTQVHQFSYRALKDLGNEMLWVSSMPCGLPTDETIPLGRYGSSNVGRAKSVYRMGLGHRYGRRMQTISGIHYNWSMPGISTEAYFGLIRNFRRHSFLLLYLFGASPALCASFVEGRDHGLQTLKGKTLYLPHATSLRMGRLGYQSDAQSSLSVSYNSLEGYAASLQEALTQPYPAYEAVGIRNPGGDYNQLATSLLQIENEFYGTIRPKRVIRSGERPLHALRERGVEYVEVRCMDLDPFEPVGIAASTMRFIDMFLLHCLLSQSADDTPSEIAELGRNQQAVAARGRQPGLLLERGGSKVTLTTWGDELLEGLAPLAERLDGLDNSANGSTAYRDALATAQARMKDANLTPSARVLAVMQASFDSSYVAFTRAQSLQTQAHLLDLPFSAELKDQFVAMSEASLQLQTQIESNDTLSFEDYRQHYLAVERLGVSAMSSRSAAEIA
ncbi:MAG: glutamate--cysteine ligase [Pseudorhodobacter sp.]|nr:glutamate--cysteine ligase [Rhizobacter sp.]